MLPIIRQLSADEKKIVGQTWARRAESKARAALRFASIANAIRAHGASPTIIGLCQRAAKDGEHHVASCQRIAQDFGVHPQLDHINRPGPLAPATLNIEHRILYEMVAISCIDEVLMGALIGKVYQSAKYPPIRLSAHLMFSDSIWHSRAGWGYLGEIQNTTSVAWLAVHLIELLERTQEHELCRPRPINHHKAHLVDYGEISDEQRQLSFKEVVNTVILPGLESYGVDISQGRAWINAWVREARDI